MIVVYLMFDIITFIIGHKIYKTIFNPISLYSAVWGVALLLHESGLIMFYELRWNTWATVFLCQAVFVAVCWMASKIKMSNSNIDLTTVDDGELKRKIKKYIYITCIVSGIAIVGNYIAMVEIYGSNLLTAITDIYADRINQRTEIEMIPYLGAFVYIAMPLSGIYMKKYGFNPVIVLPFVLGIMSALVSGGRTDFMLMGILFVMAFLSVSKKVKQKNVSRKKSIISFACIGALIIGFILVISNARNAGSDIAYATPLYVKLFGNNVLVYKMVQYIAAPVATLNEYLVTCDFNFGKNSFLTIFNLMSKFGLVERVEQYQEIFYTPIPCNVGTWIRELIEDFTYPGAIFAIIIFAAITSYVYRKAIKQDRVKNKIIWPMLAAVIILSFFDWRLRSSNMWIALLFGYIIGKRIDNCTVSGKNSRVI